ncbi:MAG: hypothetical protein E6Q97_27060 [Desulfurellales bacterium]|nr:MAG: hypothetical protein E6Q97_27060 [Desulfurellales bacterium]
MKDEEDFPDERPRIWRAIDEIQLKHAVGTEKLKMLEEIFQRHLDFHDGLLASLNEINKKLETNGLVLVEMKDKLENNKKEIDSLWAFPIKLAGIVIALGGAGTVAYKLVRWIISAGEIKIIR